MKGVEARRRRERDAKSVEGVRNGNVGMLPSQLFSGECHKLPSGIRDGDPTENKFVTSAKEVIYSSLFT